jgi:hypothetical protein
MMIKKFPVEENDLRSVHSNLLGEMTRLNVIMSYLVDVNSYDSSDISIFLSEKFAVISERYQLISGVVQSLHNVIYYEVAEPVEVAEVPAEPVEVAEVGCHNCGGTGEIHEGYFYMVCSCKKNEIEELG